MISNLEENDFETCEGIYSNEEIGLIEIQQLTKKFVK